MKVPRRYHGGIMKVSRGRILCVLYVAYSTQRRHNILTVWPGYAMLDNIPCSRPWNLSGGGRSAVRCCGLFSCLHLVPPAWGPAGKRRGPPSVGMPLLADAPTRLKGMRACLAAARLRLYPDFAAAAAPPGRARSAGGASAPPGRPCRRRPPGPAPRRALLPAPLPRGGCAAAWPVAALPPGGRLVGVPPPRVLARCGAGVAAAAGKEKAGLAAGFPGKRRIRTPFSCR